MHTQHQHDYPTLASVAQSIYPRWEPEDWFEWPPNLFGLLSIVVQRTGSYRFCLMETDWWKQHDWQKTVTQAADAWIIYINDLLLEQRDKAEAFRALMKNKLIETNYEAVKRAWNEKNIDELRVLGKFYGQENQEIRTTGMDLSKAILILMAIADVTCTGLGFTAQSSEKGKKRMRLFNAVANLLLTTTGSLCTFQKFHGIVLPKMRTPQAGLVLRSMTHHLTFHVTEVEVIWRTFPWLKNHKQNLNIMVVPYPTRVYKKDFVVVSEGYEVVRYFKGKTDEENLDEPFINALVEQINLRLTDNNEVDILVLPEMSLTELQYRFLLKKLEIAYVPKKVHDHAGRDSAFCPQLPIVVCGVIKVNTDGNTASPDNKKPSSSTDHKNAITKESENGRMVDNQAKMAIFFAGRWYDISQRKHHRWQLDRNQIVQYGLEGYFPADRKWFEWSSIGQRRLSVLVPNSWLALTALICEDLARQEPVADVVRGIGPTLLMALLSDGPQMNSRWSARYASVLADDPGTAVLSITSQGMADRSQRTDTQNLPASDDPYRVNVGLWKDMIRGWKELHLEDSNDALLFTISANFQEEFTLDGRSDNVMASVFSMESIQPRQIKLNYFNQKQQDAENKRRRGEDKKNAFYKNSGAIPAPPVLKSDNRGSARHAADTDGTGDDSSKTKNPFKKDDLVMGDWDDIREVSAFMYAIDSIIDLLSIHRASEEDEKMTQKAIQIIISLLSCQTSDQLKRKSRFYTELHKNVYNSWQYPFKVGIEAPPAPQQEICECAEEVESIVKSILAREGTNKGMYGFFQCLIEECDQRLKMEDNRNKRVKKATHLGFLYSISNKLVGRRSLKRLSDESGSDNGLSFENAAELSEKIYGIINSWQQDMANLNALSKKSELPSDAS